MLNLRLVYSGKFLEGVGLTPKDAASADLGRLWAFRTTETMVLWTPLIFMIFLCRTLRNSSMLEAETIETMSNSPFTS